MAMMFNSAVNYMTPRVDQSARTNNGSTNKNDRDRDIEETNQEFLRSRRACSGSGGGLGGGHPLPVVHLHKMDNLLQYVFSGVDFGQALLTTSSTGGSGDTTNQDDDDN